MRLDVPKVDARKRFADIRRPVVDHDTNKEVGYLDCKLGALGIDELCRFICLFDGKYVGEFETHEECVAFAEGVAAVLNHMVATNGSSE